MTRRSSNTDFYAVGPRLDQKGRTIRGFFWLAAGALTAASATAGDLAVDVEGVRNGRGAVLVAVCSAETFLGTGCRHRAAAAARPGTVEVVLRDVPPGTYAVQAIHDENGNRELDHGAFGPPREGMGFSRDAPMRMGPPKFSDAAVEVPEVGGTLRLSMRYFR